MPICGQESSMAKTHPSSVRNSATGTPPTSTAMPPPSGTSSIRATIVHGMALQRLAAGEAGQLADDAHGVAHEQALQQRHPVDRGEDELAGEANRRTVVR